MLTFIKVLRLANSEAEVTEESFDDLVNIARTLQTEMQPRQFQQFTFLQKLIEQLDPTKIKLKDFQEEQGKLIKEIFKSAVDAQLAIDKAAAIERKDLNFGKVITFMGKEDFAFNEGAIEEMRKMIEEDFLKGFGNIEALVEAVLGMNEASESAIKIGDHLREVIQAQALAFSDDFVNAILSGQDALASFKDFSRNIVSQIVAIFLQLGVVNQILNGIFGAGTFDVIGRNAAGKLAIIPAGTPESASGGTIQRNTPTLVGERGAEIFVPNTGGTILNNMNSKNAMGGQAVNIYQNVNFSTGIVPTVRAEVMSMLPQIAEVTKGAVQESAMRGGSFRRSLIGG